MNPISRGVALEGAAEDRVFEHEQRRQLGRRISRARQDAGMDQTVLGKVVGLSQSAISRIETGERKVESLELARIADACDVPAASLLGMDHDTADGGGGNVNVATALAEEGK